MKGGNLVYKSDLKINASDNGAVCGLHVDAPFSRGGGSFLGKRPITAVAAAGDSERDLAYGDPGLFDGVVALPFMDDVKFERCGRKDGGIGE